MRKLGDGEYSSLVVKKFDKALHIRLRTASVKHSTSVKAIVTDACNLWLREKNKKVREARKKHTNKNVGSSPTDPIIDGVVA